MSTCIAAWLAWSLAGFALVMFVASVALTLVSLSGAPDTWPSSTRILSAVC